MTQPGSRANHKPAFQHRKLSELTGRSPKRGRSEAGMSQQSLLLPDRLQKLRPVITQLSHAVVFGDFVGLAARFDREGVDCEVGVALCLPRLLGNSCFAGDEIGWGSWGEGVVKSVKITG